jgi:hypothetical protein
VVTAIGRVYCKEPTLVRTTNPPPLGKKLVNIVPLAKEIDVHPSAVWRWITKGVKLSDGVRLHLEDWATPAAWKTMREALQEILQKLTEDRQGRPAAELPRTPAKRAQDLARVDRELDAILGPI